MFSGDVATFLSIFSVVLLHSTGWQPFITHSDTVRPATMTFKCVRRTINSPVIIFLKCSFVVFAGVASVEVLDDWALPTVVQKGDKVVRKYFNSFLTENML